MKVIIQFFILLIFQGCVLKSKTDCAEEAINNLYQRYPVLLDRKIKQLNQYELVKSVKLAMVKNVEIQLWSSLIKFRGRTISDNQAQQIVVISNSQEECYAIPVLSNKFRDYWAFEFEEKIQTVEKVNSTFHSEYMEAMNNLKLNDTLGTCNYILDEILVSFFQAERLYGSKTLLEARKSEIQQNNVVGSSDYDTHFRDIPNENRDTCYKRMLKNINNTIDMEKSGQMIAIYFDNANERIFQIIHPKISFDPTCDFTIKVYRQDCNIHLFDL